MSMTCANCGGPILEGSGGNLRFVHVGDWSERGVREVADVDRWLCGTCSDGMLKHLKRLLSKAALGCKKERRPVALR